MTAKPLNSAAIGSAEIFYNQGKPLFQQIIAELFKTYIKSCGSSMVEGGK